MIKDERGVAVGHAEFKELEFIFEAAKRKYLESGAICSLIKMANQGRLPTMQAVQRRPQSGAVFLYDREKLMDFRVDGHEWIRKNKSAGVREDHVKLKLGKETRLYACYVHSAVTKSFHRRSYWDLVETSNIVLVHYLDKNIGAKVVHTSKCKCLACWVGYIREARTQQELERKVVEPIPTPLGGSELLSPLENVEFDAFMRGINFGDSDQDPAPPQNLPIDPNDVFMEDFAPDNLSSTSETKLLIYMSQRSGKVIPVGGIETEKISVHFGAGYWVPGVFLAGGVIKCKSPPMPFGTAVQLQVRICGIPCEFNGGGSPTVRYQIPSLEQPRQPSPTIFPPQGMFGDQPTPSNIQPFIDPRYLLKRKRKRMPMLSPKHGMNDLEETDVDQLDDDELTELSESLLQRVVKMLVELTREEKELVGQIDSLDDTGFNLLHYTVVFSHAKLVELLLEHGADPNAKTSTGDTPLHLAAEVGDKAIVAKLIDSGADFSIRDASGHTCADLAEMYGFVELQEWIHNTGQFLSTTLSSQSYSSASSGAADSLDSPPHNSLDDVFSINGVDTSPAKESREDKQNKMLRKALASMSLKDRCALSLGMSSRDRNQSITSVSSKDVNGSEGVELLGSLNFDACENTGLHSPDSAMGKESESNVHQIVSEDEGGLSAVISAMHDDERSELEEEARVIQMNIRRWLLRRNVRATRRVQTETKGFLKHKNSMEIESKATKVQAVSKGFLARREYRQARQDVIQVQAATRCLLAQKNFHFWRRQLSATVVIQRTIRAHQLRRSKG
mmetsp:Transcript_43167/g.69204  ORF Transcript_43167/g.69204 Transcript_43167/m.69204 type:complete len:788 (+) Transcript_43167:91-2454(+)